MTPLELLTLLRTSGAEVQETENGIRIKAPPGFVTRDLLEQVKAQEADVRALLREEEDALRQRLLSEIDELPEEDQLHSLGLRHCDRCDRWLAAYHVHPEAGKMVCRDTDDCREAAALRDATAWHQGTRPAAQPQDWDARTAEIVQWFTEHKSDLPTEPFLLSPWLQITEPERYYRALKGDLAMGPGGPRARQGALQADLQSLHSHGVSLDALVSSAHQRIGRCCPAGALAWAEQNVPDLLSSADQTEARWVEALEAHDVKALRVALEDWVVQHQEIARQYQSRTTTCGGQSLLGMSEGKTEEKDEIE